MIESTAPSGSSLPCSGSRDVGTRNQPATNATAMIGTFTRKTEPYQKWPSRKPLATGPIAPAAPVVAAQIAIALVRSCGGKTFTRIESVDGMISAADAPIAARQAMSCHISVDSDASAAATRKPTSPSCSAPLRPNRSPSAPVENSRPANTSEYAATTHCSCEVVACRSRESVGIATLRLALPTKTISRLRHSTASVHQRRA